MMSRTTHASHDAWEQSIARFLQLHGRPAPQRVTPLAGGQTNHIFLLQSGLEPDLILRVGPPEKQGGSLRVEAATLQRLAAKLPVPEVLLADFTRRALPGDALLLSRQPGTPFPQVWVRATASERAGLAQQVARALQLLHSTSFSGSGQLLATGGGLEVQPVRSWRCHWEERVERRLEALAVWPDADGGVGRLSRGLLRDMLPALEDRPATLLHGDFQPANWLAEGGRLTGIIDFELAQAGPIDLELDPLLRFVWDPRPFIGSGKGAESRREPYLELISLLRQAYPEPWSGPGVEQRLRLYALDYELSALRAARAGRWGPGAVPVVERRLRAVLSGEYAPLKLFGGL